MEWNSHLFFVNSHKLALFALALSYRKVIKVLQSPKNPKGKPKMLASMKPGEGQCTQLHIKSVTKNFNYHLSAISAKNEKRKKGKGLSFLVYSSILAPFALA